MAEHTSRGHHSSHHRQQVPMEGVDDLNEEDAFDLGANQEAPPAYGELYDQLQLEQPGIFADAAVTGDGRVNISINEKNHRLADLLGPTLRRQLTAEPRHRPTRPLPPAYIPPSLGGQAGQTPPPRLNVVIQIVGSRGDVQPFVALGKVLKDTYGHRVRLATHTTFQKFVEDNGLEFFNIGGDPAELMAFMVKNPGLMPGLDALKSGEITKRRQGVEEILLGCWRSCIEAGDGLGPAPPPQRPGEPIDERFSLPGDPNHQPFIADAIIANPPSFAHIHIAEKMGIPLHMMFTMPWSPTRAFPHPLANIEASNTDVVMTNYVSYALVEMMTWQGLGDVINRFRTKVLDLEPLSLIWAPGLLSRLRIPTTYCWSPALIPKPADWADEITVAGFYFLNLASSYTPDPDLAEFLAAGPPPVYIGFGSIVVDNPNALTRTIFDAVSIAGVRALVSKGWGGLGTDAVGKPDDVFMLGNVPHDWLFKHVSAVVHHGGAGTSAAGINAGKPTVVVPFFGDQPFWGSMIARAGAGPAPIPYVKLTAENLAAAITEAIQPERKLRAEELGAKIREEKGADVGGKDFHDFLDTQNMRCSLAPSRVAVWRVRRTQTRLSTLASAVLVKEGLLKYTDLKLYRPKEYTTEDQPWDPISAVSAALVGDLGSLTMAVADLPREMFKGGAKRKATNASMSPEVQLKETTSQTDESASAITGEGLASNASDFQLSTARSNESTAMSSRPSLIMSSSEEESSPGQMTPEPSTLSEANLQAATISAGSPLTHRQSSQTVASVASVAPVTIETAIGAGKGVGRIVTTGMKTPMNFCLGLAKGFRNAPRLYNDDTIRPTEKVTSFGSGLRVAGKEFGLGMYDGISGLVTHPLRGASKEGGIGFIKGFGKGIGGLVLKPAAGVWSIPAYTMQGVQAEVRNRFSRSSLNYIITSRVLQGQKDLTDSSAEEQRDIIKRWQAKEDDLGAFYLLKHQETKPGRLRGISTSHVSADGSTTPTSRTAWMHPRKLSDEERNKLQAERDAWKKRNMELQAATARSSAANVIHEDEEFERAIHASVKQTSRGNKEEDFHIEHAIRASVAEMRRIAEFSRDFKKKDPETVEGMLPPAGSSAASLPGITPTTTHSEDEDWHITDEEYQKLIEQAVHESMKRAHQGSPHLNDRDHDSEEELEEMRRALEESGVAHAAHTEEEEAMRRVMEESKSFEKTRSPELDHQEDEDLRLALHESEEAHRQELQRDKTEEEIVMEYVKKQSLAEEAFRRSKVKGKAVSQSGEKGGDGGRDDDDADLKRALEESLHMSGQSEGAGPSGSSL